MACSIMMISQSLPHSQEICQKLLGGYQFSRDDLGTEWSELYTDLDKQFTRFKALLAAIGYDLQREEGVIFLESEDKTLSQTDQQTVVVLFLLVDLWMEKGKSYHDVFHLPVPWRELDWFRDGYGREYLAQVGIAENDWGEIEKLFKRIAGKGLVNYQSDSSTVTLRTPAGRILNMARRVHAQLTQEAAREGELDEAS